MESWKPIDGFGNRYEVSDIGRVRRVGRYARKNDGGVLSPRILNGYPTATLSHECKGKAIGVHRLVAMAFVPNPDNKPHVNHIDNNTMNSHASNLEWCTPMENVHHAMKTGSFVRGEKNGMAKLTAADIELATILRRDGMSGTKIAARFGVTNATMYKALSGKTWQRKTA